MQRIVYLMLDGRRHEFDMDNPTDKIIFKAAVEAIQAQWKAGKR